MAAAVERSGLSEEPSRDFESLVTPPPSRHFSFEAFPLASPSPSPALSAYSCSTTSSIDDLSDLDHDLNSLSLEAIEEPRYHLLDNDPSASVAPVSALRDDLDPLTIDPRRLHDVSGTATPVASRSAASLRYLNHFGSPSSFTSTSTGTDAYPSLDTVLASNTSPPQPPSEDPDEIAAANGEADSFDLEDVDEEDMHADGVPAARGWRLDARQADTDQFRSKVLQLFSQELKLVGWSQDTVDPSLWPLSPKCLRLKRISGAFTNAVFFASYKPTEGIDVDSLSSAASTTRPTPPPTVLLRVYGAACEVLLSRRAELLILHTLSSLYEIGPHILGTFANGRVEEFYDCDPIQKEGMRDFGDREAFMVPTGGLIVKGREGPAHWVARRMNELHSVPLEVIKTVLEQGNLRGPSEKGFGRGIENHIMASSHRPRRKQRTRPLSSKAGSNAGWSSERNNSLTSPSMHSADSRNLMRASPAPMSASESPAANGIEYRDYSYMHRNSSAASLDSLATSYNSQSSFFGESPAMASLTSPNMSGSSGTDTPQSYFPPMSNGPVSPLALNPIGKPVSSRNSGSRGPYPGVWRRLKRWSREAAKVIELVEAFARSDSGARAVALCFSGRPSIRQEMQSGTGALSTATIGPTPGNLRNTLRCIRAIDLASLLCEIDEFKQFVRRWERREGPSRRVFSHNDAQYGNLLAIKNFPPKPIDELAQVHGGEPRSSSRSSTGEVASIPAGMPRLSSIDSGRDSNPSASIAGGSARGARPAAAPRSLSRSRIRARKAPPPHHRVVVIDFEYSGPNPRGYDIANHFQEWRADYHHPSLSWSLMHHGSYPDEQQRRKWLRAYVEQGRLLRMGGKFSKAAPAGLETPTDMALPPPVSTMQRPAANAAIKGPITTERPSAPVTPISGAAQVSALERSSGERSRPAMPQQASSTSKIIASANGSQSRRGSTSGSSTHSSNEAASTAAPLRTLRHKGSQDSVSTSSWQAPPSGSLRAVGVGGATPSTGPITPVSPTMDASASPQILALTNLDASIEKEVDRLEREVMLWSPATHAVWGLWGIVFAQEEVEAVLKRAIAEAEGDASGDSVLGDAKTDSIYEAGSAESFDNLRYALGRIELFRQEFRQLVEIGNENI
ncbi:kinase-like protein [Testicularia cyperi]|uniref:Kinase-like protein n=1 Tax=Testicularia cyperi TaxID=1882483 RepID=A0A317XLF0_9BASI|nr:kinase-like protein [Testicularia cyperi]